MVASNKNLRSSLSMLEHPSSLSEVSFRSEEWKRCMVRLYRTVLRLHNKPIAVSMFDSMANGPAHAVAAVTQPAPSSPSSAEVSSDDLLLRYILSDQQRAFGNYFVKDQFMSHMQVDSVTALNFYASWYDYVGQLTSGITERDLTDGELCLLTEQEKSKLDALRAGMVAMRSEGTEP